MGANSKVARVETIETVRFLGSGKGNTGAVDRTLRALSRLVTLPPWCARFGQDLVMRDGLFV